MTLSELIERVEGLDGPSREVDAQIDAALRVGKINMEPWVWDNFPVWRAAQQTGMCEVVHSNGAGGLVWNSQPFTASLDTAIALRERVLPDFGLSIETHPVYGDWWDAAIFDQMPKTVSNARKQTAALALCLSILRALGAQERDDGR